MVDVDMLAATVRQHQVGAFPSAMTPRSSRPSACAGCFADQTDRLRQGEGVILGVGDAECGIQQAGRIVVGRENVEQTVVRQQVGGDVAGWEPPRTIFGAPIRTCIPC